VEPSERFTYIINYLCNIKRTLKVSTKRTLHLATALYYDGVRKASLL
jgi:hypothetical protein